VHHKVKKSELSQDSYENSQKSKLKKQTYLVQTADNLTRIGQSLYMTNTHSYTQLHTQKIRRKQPYKVMLKTAVYYQNLLHMTKITTEH